MPRFQAWRAYCWLAGLLVAFVALASPLAAYDDTLFSLHMVQHLLLVMVAAPLLVLGAPVALAMRAASVSVRGRLIKVMHSAPLSVVGHPVFTWLFFGVVMWVTHFTSFYNAALESNSVHVFEHAVYLIAGFLFWWPVVGADPGAHRLKHPARLVYIMLAMPQQAALGLVIYSASHILYAHYATLDLPWGPGPLIDQDYAGQIMWIGGNFMMLFPFVSVIFAWMRHDERAAVRLDRRLDAARAAQEPEGRPAS